MRVFWHAFLGGMIGSYLGTMLGFLTWRTFVLPWYIRREVRKADWSDVTEDGP